MLGGTQGCVGMEEKLETIMGRVNMDNSSHSDKLTCGHWL